MPDLLSFDAADRSEAMGCEPEPSEAGPRRTARDIELRPRRKGFAKSRPMGEKRQSVMSKGERQRVYYPRLAFAELNHQKI